MKDHDFVWGMAMGLTVGTTMGVMMAPGSKRKLKKAADKALKTVGEVMEDLSEEIGLN